MIKGKYNADMVIGEMAAIVENGKKMTYSGFRLMDEGTWVKQIGVKVNGVSWKEEALISDSLYAPETIQNFVSASNSCWDCIIKDAANDTLIHGAIKYAFLMSPDIHSMQIDVDVKDGVVELFGKVKSAYEAA